MRAELSADWLAPLRALPIADLWVHGLALVGHAFTHDEVGVVLAHTLPGSLASQRVLTKCGFRHVGEVIDPGDGLVWRFEKHR